MPRIPRSDSFASDVEASSSRRARAHPHDSPQTRSITCTSYYHKLKIFSIPESHQPSRAALHRVKRPETQTDRAQRRRRRRPQAPLTRRLQPTHDVPHRAPHRPSQEHVPELRRPERAHCVESHAPPMSVHALALEPSTMRVVAPRARRTARPDRRRVVDHRSRRDVRDDAHRARRPSRRRARRSSTRPSRGVARWAGGHRS